MIPKFCPECVNYVELEILLKYDYQLGEFYECIDCGLQFQLKTTQELTGIELREKK